MKPGYKQTEVGVIPEDWAVAPLAGVTDCLDNLRVPLNESERAKRAGDIPYCGANGVLDYVDDYVIDDDIILMAEDGGYFDEYMTRPIAYRMTGKVWVNNHAHILKAKSGSDQGFVFFSLVHKNILRFLASGTRAKLNRSELNKIEIPFPPTKAEQEAIAEALGDADALIESLERLLAKKRQLKQGAMQELLTGKRRLPGFEKKPGYKQTEIGPIPIDWDYRRLTDVAVLESGHTPSKRQPRYWGGEIPWVSLHDTDALSDREIHRTERTVTQAGIDNSSARVLPAGTVVFSRTATVGKATTLGREMATSQDFANYVCGPSLCNHYLVYLFRFMAPEWRKLMAGSTHNTVYMPVFRSLRVVLPPKAEQDEIASILNDMDLAIDSVLSQLAKARQLKHGMMQELLTGRIRLV